MKLQRPFVNKESKNTCALKENNTSNNNSVSLGNDAPSKRQPRTFFLPLPPSPSPQVLKKLRLDIITLNLLSYSQFCPIVINRTVFQYLLENFLKQGTQKLGQTGRFNRDFPIILY